jgi:hypothetical protein
MKRITIVAVLALVSAFATGCYSQTVEDENTQESEQSSRGSGDGSGSDERHASFIRGPQQALDLNLHPSTDSQGPHPEPWQNVMGPHPEPWEGKVSTEADPNRDPNAPSGASKP